MYGTVPFNIACFSIARFVGFAGVIVLFTTNTWQIREQTGSALRVVEAISIAPLVGALTGNFIATVFLSAWSRRRTLIVTSLCSAAMYASIAYLSRSAENTTAIIYIAQVLAGCLTGISDPALDTFLADLGGKGSRGSHINNLVQACAFSFPLLYLWWILRTGALTSSLLITHSYSFSAAAALICCAMYCLIKPMTPAAETPAVDAMVLMKVHSRHPVAYLHSRFAEFYRGIAAGGRTLRSVLVLVLVQQIFFTNFFLFPGYVMDAIHGTAETHVMLRFLGSFLAVPALCALFIPAVARRFSLNSMRAIFFMLFVQGVGQMFWPLLPNVTIGCAITSFNWIPYAFGELAMFRVFQQLEGDSYRGDFFPLKQLVMRSTALIRWIVIWLLSLPQVSDSFALSDGRRIAVLGVCGVFSLALIAFWSAAAEREGAVRC